MNALPQSFPATGSLRFERMTEASLDEVVAIENDVYPFPWSADAFAGAIRAGNECWLVRDAAGALAGYFVVMNVVDEAHLLTIVVRRDLQGQGMGKKLLDDVILLARDMGMLSVVLEVRPSNERAVDMYRRYGFAEIGRRKGYYPAADNTREEAIVMRLPL